MDAQHALFDLQTYRISWTNLLVALEIGAFTLVGVAIVRLASLAVCLNVDELLSSEEFGHGVGIGGRGARQ